MGGLDPDIRRLFVRVHCRLRKCGAISDRFDHRENPAIPGNHFPGKFYVSGVINSVRRYLEIASRIVLSSGPCLDPNFPGMGLMWARIHSTSWARVGMSGFSR